MRKSWFISGVAAGLAGAAAYYLTSQRSAPLRRNVQQRARESAAWLQGQQRELADGLHRIELQINQLGDEMRQRLDQLARQASDAVQPQLDADWGLEKDDLQESLRSLPGQR